MKRHIHSRVGVTLLFLLLLSLPAAAQISDVYVLPAMANAPGGAGTYWVNDFFVMNPQAYPLEITVLYLPSGAGQMEIGALTLAANETWWAENILEALDVFEKTGSLVVFVDPEENPTVPDDPAARGVIVQSRSFTRTPLPTMGQGVPGVWTGLLDYDLDGISAIATGVRNWGTAGTDGFRTNVGGVNLSRVSTNLWVRLFSDEGVALWEQDFRILPQTHMQAPLPAQVQHGTLEFWVQFPPDYSPTETDFVIPYASVVDNRTGDPTYLNPTLLALPGVLGKQGTAARAAPQRISAAAIRALVDDAIAARGSKVRLPPARRKCRSGDEGPGMLRKVTVPGRFQFVGHAVQTRNLLRLSGLTSC